MKTELFQGLGGFRSATLRPNDTLMMGGHMDLMTVTQQTGAQGLGGNRSATIKPRYNYRALNWH